MVLGVIEVARADAAVEEELLAEKAVEQPPPPMGVQVPVVKVSRVSP